MEKSLKLEEWKNLKKSIKMSIRLIAIAIFIRGCIEKELNHHCISSIYRESYETFTPREGNLPLIL